MRADYDSEANAISITLVQGAHAQRADQRHPRAIVALRDDKPIELQLLYPDLGVKEPMRAVADHYGLDPEALIAAANAALAAPNRVVTLEVAVRSTA
ncbi:MAG: hypothetical protein WA862_09420 [Solirubrobacterales bacterium]